MHLRLKEARAKELESIYGKLGAKVIDELSQINAQLFHADAYITTVARAPT